MHLNVKLVVRPSDARKSDGTAPVFLRITGGGKVSYKSTDVRVNPKHWNKKREAVREYDQLASAKNAKLKAAKLEAERAALDTSTVEAAKEALGGGPNDFTDYFERFINSRSRREHFWQRKKFRTALNKLQATFGKERIDFSELDLEALQRFENHLREVCGNNENTARAEISRVRQVVKQAMAEGKIKLEDDPFRAYKMPNGKKTAKRKLRREEMRAMGAVQIRPEMELTRDAFMFAFFASGARFGDVCRFRPQDVRDGRVRYRMAKTKDPVNLAVPPEGMQVAERWKERGGDFLFPFLEGSNAADPVAVRRRISSRNVVVNRQLKEIAEAAEVRNPEEVSFHVARHSFAFHAWKKTKDLYALMKALRHKNLKTTQIYLESLGIDTEITDPFLAEVWNGDK